MWGGGSVGASREEKGEAQKTHSFNCRRSRMYLGKDEGVAESLGKDGGRQVKTGLNSDSLGEKRGGQGFMGKHLITSAMLLLTGGNGGFEAQWNCS